MNVNDNVKLCWEDLRRDQIIIWRGGLEDVLVPAMAQRGWNMQSESVREPLENNEVEVSWSYTKGNWYLWIDCRTHMGISARIFPQDKPRQQIQFPPPETPELNMSFADFFAWLDGTGV